MAPRLLFPGQTDGKKWVMKDGSVISVTQMSDSHLTNAVEMLMRGIKSRQESVSLLLKERDRRKQVEAEAAKQRALHASIVETNDRLIRD